jgi:hypothetical protein
VIRHFVTDTQWKPLLNFLLLSFALVAGFEAVFSHLQEGGLFDRHLVIVAYPLCLAGCIFAHRPERPTIALRLPFRIAAIVLAGIMAAFCIASTHDYIAWNRLRWELGNEALAQGVNPLHMSAGFEFNAWHNYDVFRARGKVEKVYSWWYDARDYLITLKPEAGYRAIEQKEFYSWVHRRPMALYLLQKIMVPEEQQK